MSTLNSNRKTDDPRPSLTVKVEWKVSRRLADDILVTALDPGYGGSLYWATVDEYRPKGRWATADDNTRSAVLHDTGNPHIQYVVDYSTVCIGLQRAVACGWMNAAKGLVEDDGGQFDATLADVVLQFALFSKVVYG